MSELWTVTLRFRGAHAPPVSLFFGGEAAARKEFKALCEAALASDATHDHYGTSIAVFGDLEAVILQDVGKAFEAEVEMGLKRAIAQGKAERRALSDPELRFVTGHMPGTGKIRG